MSSNAQPFASFPYLTSAFLYRDVAAPLEEETKPILSSDAPSEAHLSALAQEAIAQQIAKAREQAIAETEARLRAEMESRLAEQAGKIQTAIAKFVEERRSYFSRVESDVVHLALNIAAKILHREAQVDPLLIAALVRIAVNKLHDGSTVTVRVAGEDVQRWTEFFADASNGSTIQVVEDAHLSPGDCVLETDLGSANFGIEAQLKEVEQGFFDLLAQRPIVK